MSAICASLRFRSLDQIDPDLYSCPSDPQLFVCAQTLAPLRALPWERSLAPRAAADGLYSAFLGVAPCRTLAAGFSRALRARTWSAARRPQPAPSSAAKKGAERAGSAETELLGTPSRADRKRRAVSPRAVVRRAALPAEPRAGAQLPR